MTVSMSKVDIINIDIIVWNQKNKLLQSNYIHSLTKHEITRQVRFKLTYIGHDQKYI